MQPRLRQHLTPEQGEGERGRAAALAGRRGRSAELDERGSDVRSQATPRWLWQALEHHTGQGLASVFGRRQETVCLARKARLEPWGLTRYCTDGWGAYARHGEAEPHPVGQANTQKSESKPMTLRTRLKRLGRRTLCFSKTERMPDLVNRGSGMGDLRSYKL